MECSGCSESLAQRTQVVGLECPWSSAGQAGEAAAPDPELRGICSWDTAGTQMGGTVMQRACLPSTAPASKELPASPRQQRATSASALGKHIRCDSPAAAPP